MLLVKLKRPYKGFPELRQEMERSSEKGNMASYRLAACKSRYSLVYDRLKDRSRKVFLLCSVVYERLYICFRENTASCGYRINVLIILCKLVKTCCICLQKACHLVYKGTRTAGTDTIHSLFDIITLEIDDLRILSSELDRYICFRGIFLKCR